MPKIINNDDFECVLGTPPPKQTTQPFHGHNLPPEELQPLPQSAGGSTTKSTAGKKSKPLDLEDADDFLFAVNEIIQKRKDIENGRELAIQAAQKELGFALIAMWSWNSNLLNAGTAVSLDVSYLC